MRVLKFGGTSVGSPESIRSVLEIVKQQQKEGHAVTVVLSAFSGVTNTLIKLSTLAQQRDEAYQTTLEELRLRHKEMIGALMGEKAAETEELIMPLILELSEIIHGTFLLRECSPRSTDLIQSFGERLSATIVSSFLKHNGINARFTDARNMIVTDSQFGSARIDFETTNQNMAEIITDETAVHVVTGFIAANPNGVTTTLGRGGSDYTAAVIAAALNANEIQIWTDVNGVMTTNPKMVKEAFSLSHLTYEEAMELSHFGAKVLHPPTIQPALERHIPIRILNTFNTAFKGTTISSNAQENNHIITGLTAIDKVSLLTIEGSGMVGVPGVAARLFQALANKKVNVILITQASSEHSICVAVIPEQARTARKAIESEFKYEIKAREMEPVQTEKELSVIAVVGKNMRSVPGITGKLFHALAQKSINVVAISQGSSELNISVVINRSDQKRALNAIHKAFYFSQNGARVKRLFIAGKGLIGATLLKQMSLIDKPSLKVCGIIGSQKMWLDEKGIDLEKWPKTMENSGEKADLAAFCAQAANPKMGQAVFVDCSASEAVSDQYTELISKSVSVVTANKIMASRDMDQVKKLQQALQTTDARFLNETNVGAGLPVLSTMEALLASGDTIHKIEAVLSGTLSYIFNAFNSTERFKDIVKKAKDLGYTEPDPRNDLNGMDVARKILILARIAGAKLNLSDLEPENFLPQSALKAKNVDDFFVQLEKENTHFAEMVSRAEKNTQKLRYIAQYQNGKITIGLQAVDGSHPFYNLSGSDNVVALYTQRYNQTPLVITGSGAGAEVTAAGVLADILKIN